MNVAVLFMIAAIALAAGALPQARGSADLNAYLVPGQAEGYFDVTYHRTYHIGHGEGGELAGLLGGAGGTVEVAAQDGDLGAEAVAAALNESIRASGSGSSVRVHDVKSVAAIRANPLDTEILYVIRIRGMLAGHTAGAAEGGRPAIVDMAWRDLTVREPVTIRGTEINIPRSAFGTLAPGALAAMPDGAAALLDIPLIAAAGLQEAPLETWRFIYDPTGLAADAGHLGVSWPASGLPVTVYSYRESSDVEGAPSGWKETVDFELDRPYFIRAVDPVDRAAIHIAGFAEIGGGGGETVSVLPEAREAVDFLRNGGGEESASAGGFQAMIVYAAPGLGVAAVAAYFALRRRVPKRDAEIGQGAARPR